MGDRCTGECCKAFTLPFTHVMFASYLNETPMDRVGHGVGFVDGELILAMAVPLPDLGPDRYTCRLFDGVNCTVYEMRPAMCRDYPYNEKCEHGEKCQWEEARKGEHPRLTELRVGT